MIAVVSIIGLVAAISFPSVTSGIDSVRLTSAADSVAAFLNSALDRAERRRYPVEVTVSVPENSLTMRSTEPGFIRVLQMPESISIQRVLPMLPPGADETIRRFYLYPAGSVPAVGIELANRRGVHRIVRVDPVSGVPQVEQIQQPENP